MRKKYIRRRAPSQLPKTTRAYTPSQASEICLPAEPSTQADIMSRGLTSIDIVYHILYQLN